MSTDIKIQIFDGATNKNFEDFILQIQGIAIMKNPDHAKVFEEEKKHVKHESSTYVFYLLCSTTSGPALQVIKEVTPGDGFEAIRSLKKAFCNAGPERATVLIAEFFNLSFQNFIHFRQHFMRITLEALGCKLPLLMLRHKIIQTSWQNQI